MVQYGSRRYEREGVASLASLLPDGSGLLTVNNLLGLFLALLLVYHLYRDSDWSFLRSPPAAAGRGDHGGVGVLRLVSGIDPCTVRAISACR